MLCPLASIKRSPKTDIRTQPVLFFSKAHRIFQIVLTFINDRKRRTITSYRKCHSKLIVVYVAGLRKQQKTPSYWGSSTQNPEVPGKHFPFCIGRKRKRSRNQLNVNHKSAMKTTEGRPRSIVVKRCHYGLTGCWNYQ